MRSAPSCERDVAAIRDARAPALITWRGRPNTCIGGSPETGCVATPASETPEPFSSPPSHSYLNLLRLARNSWVKSVSSLLTNLSPHAMARSWFRTPAGQSTTRRRDSGRNSAASSPYRHRGVSSDSRRSFWSSVASDRLNAGRSPYPRHLSDHTGRQKVVHRPAKRLTC